MAVLSSINVDSDGIPSAAGTDSVPTLKPLTDLIDTGALLTRPAAGTVNANGRAAASASAPVVLSTEDLAAVNGAASMFYHLDLDETKREVKGSAGRVYGFEFANFSDTARYVKFYNAPSASVTVGTTTPVFLVTLPPRSASGDPTIITRAFPRGLVFSSGITVACVTGKADNSTGAPSADDVVCDHISYE